MTKRRRRSSVCVPATAISTAVDRTDHSGDTLHTIIDASSDPVFSVDREYRYTSFNASHAEAMQTLHGVDIGLGDSVVTGWSVVDGAVAKADFDRALGGESFIEKARLGDGKADRVRHAHEVAHYPIRDADAVVVGVVVQVSGLSDVTMESALRVSELRYRSYVDNAPYGIVVTDENGRCLEVNPAAAVLTGYAEEELASLSIADILALESLPSWQRQFAGLLRTGASSGNAIIVRKVGTRFQARIDAVRLAAVRYLCFIVDVSEQRRAEEEILAGAARLTSALEATVTALGAATELRDPYTAGHQLRVAQLVGAIAAGLGWDEARIETLKTAARLHDIGKIVVPAEILTKPGRLSETEMQLVRQHAAASAALISDIEFGGPVAAIVSQHHERLDGTGYPAGLVGAHILPEARVLAVADVVEAMLSHRPYRAALGVEAALAEIEEGSGSRYDAEACETCVRLFREQGFMLTASTPQWPEAAV